LQYLKRNTNIPINLIKLVNKKKIVNQFRLYMYLNRNTDGVFSINDKLIEDANSLFGYKTNKSFHNNLIKLLDLGWVGKDKNGIYFVRGIQWLCDYYGFSSLKRAIFRDQDFAQFRAFIDSAAIGQVCASIKVRAGKMSLATHLSNVDGQRLSNSYLSKALNVSMSKAQRMKTLMAKSGYGTKEREFDEMVGITVHDIIKLLDTGHVKPEFCVKREIRDGKWKSIAYVNRPTRVKSFIPLKRVKKINKNNILA